ncbi:MAG: MFS transporter, partial [Chloroflexota bacterium]
MARERTQEKPRLFTPAYTLLLAATALFFLSLHAITPILPLYGVAVGADTSTVGWLVGAFSISALLARPYAGSLGERLGRKPLFIAGALIFTLAPLLYIWARSVPLLIAVRMVHGTGIALFVVGAYVLVADLVPPSRRGEGMGYYSLTTLLGMAVAPPLAVPMLAVVGFEGIFIASSIAGASSLLLGLLVPDARPTVHYGPPPGFLAVARYRFVLIPSLALVGGTMSFGAIQSFLPLYT